MTSRQSLETFQYLKIESKKKKKKGSKACYERVASEAGKNQWKKAFQGVDIQLS